MPVVKANALTEGNNNSWNLVLPAWVNADTEEQRTALNTWKVRMTLEDERAISRTPAWWKSPSSRIAKLS